MADNYLEKRYEECFGSGAKTKKRVIVNNPSLDSLLLRNRSCRGYDHSRKVTVDDLKKIAGVCDKIASGMNRQPLRFRLAVGEEAASVAGEIRLGGALPELHLPFPGTEPQAFIIICSKVEPDKWAYMDVGIAAQSMLLKAVEMGLNGICIGAFDKARLTKTLNLQYEPVLVLAIGKSAEKIQIVHIAEDASHAYYRRDGIHYVPKIKGEDLIISSPQEESSR